VLGSMLIGLDSPNHGATLVELGIRWGRPFGATLVGLGIVDEPGIRALEPLNPVGGKPGVDPVYYKGYHARLADVVRQVEHRLRRFAARCDEAGVPHSEIKGTGSPSDLLEREAQSCDLILMARRAHFRFIAQDDERDDTLKKVLKNTPRPMVVVPKACPDGPVVIACDGSLQSSQALAAFQATGLGESSKVYVLSVSSRSREAVDHTNRARRFLGYHNVEAIPLALESSLDPATVILEQVGLLGAGLVVMGAYGQPALREFFLGSVTRRMLTECPVPLFLFH
jgi:nucleotide-binding universal stress UspA family protein